MLGTDVERAEDVPLKRPDEYWHRPHHHDVWLLNGGANKRQRFKQTKEKCCKVGETNMAEFCGETGRIDIKSKETPISLGLQLAWHLAETVGRHGQVCDENLVGERAFCNAPLQLAVLEGGCW